MQVCAFDAIKMGLYVLRAYLTVVMVVAAATTTATEPSKLFLFCRPYACVFTKSKINYRTNALLKCAMYDIAHCTKFHLDKKKERRNKLYMKPPVCLCIQACVLLLSLQQNTQHTHLSRRKCVENWWWWRWCLEEVKKSPTQIHIPYSRTCILIRLARSFVYNRLMNK